MDDQESDKNLLEQAFELIEKGNKFEKSSDFWEATDAFHQAMVALRDLSEQTLLVNKEQTRIAQLYHEQSREYLNKARSTFVQALTSEQAQDETRRADHEEPIHETLSDEEAEFRIRLFMSLFSKEISFMQASEEEQGIEQGVDEKQTSLEERFRELNKSIPQGIKSEDERMKDIGRGLGRLGLSLSGVNETTKPGFDFPPPPSKSEQLADIMAQAKDEARYEAMMGRSNRNAYDESDDFSLSDSDLDDDSDSDELDLVSDEELVLRLQNRKAIRKAVVKAQVQLAELVALLDANKEPKTGNAKKEGMDDESGEEDNDDDAAAAGIDLPHGRRLLSKARAYLTRASSKWIVE